MRATSASSSSTTPCSPSRSALNAAPLSLLSRPTLPVATPVPSFPQPPRIHPSTHPARQVLSKLIVGEGHEVEYRRSGEEALELLKTEHFDAVLITMYAPHPAPPRPAANPIVRYIAHCSDPTHPLPHPPRSLSLLFRLPSGTCPT